MSKKSDRNPLITAHGSSSEAFENRCQLIQHSYPHVLLLRQINGRDEDRFVVFRISQFERDPGA